MIIVCPKCGLRLTSDDSLAGKQGRCPDCREVFIVAAPADGTSPPPLPGVRQPLRPCGAPDKVARGCYRGYLLCGSLIIAIIGLIFISSLLSIFGRQPFDGLFLAAGLLTILLAVAYAAALVLYLIVLYRMWRAVQPAEITPGAAVGFMLMPLFNVYWAFRTHGGWCQWYNRRLAATGAPSRPASRALGNSVVIVWAASLLLVVLAVALISDQTPEAAAAGGIAVLMAGLCHLAYFILLACFLKNACDGIDALSPLPLGGPEA
ncbi:MAG: DUF4328 domain-containing protein [Planctomycetaceae bacterium]|nr:zinc-ribbon domain-containing protein [Planctomycetaceae bacterium]